MSDEFVYDEYRQRKIREKIDEKIASRVKTKVSLACIFCDVVTYYELCLFCGLLLMFSYCVLCVFGFIGFSIKQFL